MLTARASPAFEHGTHREQRAECAGATEHRPALGGVGDGADDRERVVGQRAHDPGRLHVDRQRARLCKGGPFAAAHVAR